jgi:succinate dehydrogenase/fumarate reductase flavoprotein subunit
MSDEELVKRLRDPRTSSEASTARHQAADRIEALTAENKRLGQQCEGLMQAGMNNGQALIIAEAKLAKAVELLKEARQDLEAYVTHDWPKDVHPHYDKKWERDMELCRRIDALLAVIEGSNDP